MKCVIIINQETIVEAGLHKYTDFTDWAILDSLEVFYIDPQSKKIILKDVAPPPLTDAMYVGVRYEDIITETPLLKITKEELIERIKKLITLGLIKTIQTKSEDEDIFYFTFTNYYSRITSGLEYPL